MESGNRSQQVQHVIPTAHLMPPILALYSNTMGRSCKRGWATAVPGVSRRIRRPILDVVLRW